MAEKKVSILCLKHATEDHTIRLINYVVMRDHDSLGITRRARCVD